MDSGEIDLVIFDCDGVLIDSEIISAKTLMAALEDFGVEATFPISRQTFWAGAFRRSQRTFERPST
ncbi:hypothetical protein [uncultured Roseibium sp.]|uniref:hypothetical protein n=1 Tax=uncultured Roseibium sp. TaxID=1936171 RepID=UPI0032177C35